MIAPQGLIDVWGLKRVSTDAQDMARQARDLEKLRQKHGLNYLGIIELQGVSGTKTGEHQEVQAFLRNLQKPLVKGLAVSSLDRLFRPKNFRDPAMLDVFVEHQKSIWTVREGLIEPWTDEGFNTCWDAIGRAGAELREIVRRFRGGREDDLEQGLLDHGTAPYGFLYLKKWQEGGRHFIEDTTEVRPGLSKANVVRLIFNLRRSGMGPTEIAHQLNAEGILSPGNGRLYPPGLWGRQIIIQILRNPSYKGQHRRMGRTIPCPALVDAGLWEAAQEVRATSRERNQGRPPKADKEYLLRKYLWCAAPGCGHRIVCGSSTGWKQLPMWRCGNIENRTRTRRCDAPGIAMHRLDPLAWGLVWKVITDPELLLSLAADYYAAIEKERSEADVLRQEGRDLEESIELTQKMIRSKRMKYDQGVELIDQDQKRLDAIRARLKALGQVLALPPLHIARAAVERIQSGPEPTEYRDRRDVLEGLLDLKMHYYDGELVVEGKVPVPEDLPAAGSSKKNCSRRVDAHYSSFAPIPFSIKGRVA